MMKIDVNFEKMVPNTLSQKFTLRGLLLENSWRALSKDTSRFKIDSVVEKLFRFIEEIYPKAPRGGPRERINKKSLGSFVIYDL